MNFHCWNDHFTTLLSYYIRLIGDDLVMWASNSIGEDMSIED